MSETRIPLDRWGLISAPAKYAGCYLFIKSASVGYAADQHAGDFQMVRRRPGLTEHHPDNATAWVKSSEAGKWIVDGGYEFSEWLPNAVEPQWNPYVTKPMKWDAFQTEAVIAAFKQSVLAAAGKVSNAAAVLTDTEWARDIIEQEAWDGKLPIRVLDVMLQDQDPDFFAAVIAGPLEDLLSYQNKTYGEPIRDKGLKDVRWATALKQVSISIDTWQELPRQLRALIPQPDADQ